MRCIHLKYKKITSGRFISRPNRFIAQVEIDGGIHTVHVKNTGRCRELLVPGAKVYLEISDNPARKTKYDLIAVEKETDRGILLVNMDSQIPNAAAGEWLKKSGMFSENAVIMREKTFGKSRFDFCIEDGSRKIFLEVKGVTLEYDGIAMFPDAPTERGLKHINELISCVENGYEAYILFVIQMKGMKCFMPHDEVHPEFGEALRNAAEKGVRIIARDCIVTPDSMTVDSEVTVNLR